MADWSIYKSHGSGGKGNLVDPAQLPAAQEHKIVLDIIPNANTQNTVAATITGFMKEQFNYSVAAQYNKIIDIPGSNGLMRYAKDITNADAAWHSGFFSKKMFEPGNAYSKLDLKFRVYDNPDVIQDCDLLVACCLPMVAGNSPILQKNVVGVGVAAVNSVGTEIGNVVKKSIDMDGSGMVGSGLEAFMSMATTRKPPHINVSIGSYFKKNEMVLTSVDFTYSKEFIYSNSRNKSYPAFVDFNISVESLYSMLALTNDATNETDRIFGTGFEEWGGKRVRVVNSAVNENPISAAIQSFKDGFR